MKSLIAFSQVVLEDLGDRCGISTSRDFKTVTARVEHEGLSFLAIVLPKFGKDFQKSLDRGFVAHDSFPGFRRMSGLPHFLGGFLELVFDRETGRLLEFPSLDAIFAVHQFTSMYKKIEAPVSEKRVRSALEGWIECEKEVRLADSSRTPAQLEAFERVSSLFLREIFSTVDRMVYDGEIKPRHGSGATAERLTSNGKYLSNMWTTRLEEVFPFGENLFPNWGWYHQFQRVDLLEPGAEIPVRVITVPKTLKAPRIIAIEPTCMQYMQQGVLEAIVESVQRSDTLRQLVGWHDQEPNRNLACHGSLYGDLATLDLSEASDRVSNQLVRTMLRRWPHLHRAVDACRSRKADVPGFGVQRLAKFASMGSALCFPFESFVFLTIIGLSWEQVHRRQLSKRDVQSLIGRVRVYGDDIIVPVDMVESVIGNLEAYGLKVNHDKSFWTGQFRESCGGDYYAGHRITPVKISRFFPSSRKHVEQLVSTTALRNNLFEIGMERSVEFLDRLIGKILPVYPAVPRTSSALGRWSHQPLVADGSDPRLHKPFVKAYVVESTLPKDILGEHGALMKWFLKRSDLPVEDRDHLLRAGRPESSRIKLRKVSLV